MYNNLKLNKMKRITLLEKGKPLFQTTYNILANAKRPNNAQKSIKIILNNAENELKNELSKKTIGEILIEMND